MFYLFYCSSVPAQKGACDQTVIAFAGEEISGAGEEISQKGEEISGAGEEISQPPEGVSGGGIQPGSVTAGEEFSRPDRRKGEPEHSFTPPENFGTLGGWSIRRPRNCRWF
jgi:hypothetical protein